jgi:hypothetical protein
LVINEVIEYATTSEHITPSIEVTPANRRKHSLDIKLTFQTDPNDDNKDLILGSLIQTQLRFLVNCIPSSLQVTEVF